jgi:ferrous iron transport protein A
MEVLLSEVTQSSKLKIIRILATELEAKFAEMGLISDKEICWIYRAPLNDPIAIEVDDYVLSLRLDEAKYILVTRI